MKNVLLPRGQAKKHECSPEPTRQFGLKLIKAYAWISTRTRCLISSQTVRLSQHFLHANIETPGEKHECSPDFPCLLMIHMERLL